MEKIVKPNVIVDKVKDLSSPTRIMTAVSGKMPDTVIKVNFGGGRSGNLDLRDHRAVTWADILDNMH